MKNVVTLVLALLGALAVFAQQNPYWLTPTGTLNHWSTPPGLTNNFNAGFTSGLTAVYSNSGDLQIAINALSSGGGYQISAAGMSPIVVGLPPNSSFSMPDMTIIPVPNNCNRYYVVYATGVNWNGLHVWYTVMDYSNLTQSWSATAVDVPLLSAQGVVWGAQTLAMATSQITGLGDRRLYFICDGFFGGISSFVVDNTGIHTRQTVVATAALPAFSMQATSLELSPNGRKLAWAEPGGDIRMVTLNAFWQFQSSQSFAIPNSTSCSGVEFTGTNNELFCSVSGGADQGVNAIDVTQPGTVYTHVPGSGAFDQSWVELARTKSMYVANATGYQEIVSNSYSMGAFKAGSPAYMNVLSPIGYTLPDQIDGEDYLAHQQFVDLGPDLKRCEGNCVELSVRFPSPLCTYVWSGPGGLTHTGSSLCTTVELVGMNTYTVQAFCPGGCNSTGEVDILAYAHGTKSCQYHSAEAACCKSGGPGDTKKWAGEPEQEFASSLTAAPNPFSHASKIAFSVATDSEATLNMYDATGRLVETLYSGNLMAGEQYNVEFNGAEHPDGIYVYILRTATETMHGKLVLNK